MSAYPASVSPRTNSGDTTRPRLRAFSVDIGVELPRGNVRRRGRERWQARVYIGGRAGGSVSLGHYGSETAAAQVIRKVLRKLLSLSLAAAELEEPSGKAFTARLGPLDVWKAAQRLAADGWDVDGQLAELLPRGVARDGKGGYGIRPAGGNGFVRGGFETPEAAYRAVLRERARLNRRAGRGGGEAGGGGNCLQRDDDDQDLDEVAAESAESAGSAIGSLA